MRSCSFGSNNLDFSSEVLSGRQPSKINISLVTFWVRVFDLSFGSECEEIAKAVGRALGVFVPWETVIEKSYKEKFMRLHVVLDLNKPLMHDSSVIREETSNLFGRLL